MTDNTINTCPAIILSSGLSERMGQPKALLRWNRSVTFIEKIIDEFCGFGCRPVICMINKIIEPECRKMKVPPEVRFVVNNHPEWGRFYSVKEGIREVVEADFCFIHNVDNPFVDRDILGKLSSVREAGAWCSPVYDGRGGHPVLVSSSIIKTIAGVIGHDITLADILNLSPKIIAEADSDTILRNINTQKDYERYFGPGI